jgi:methylmalonyl-CoA decarboxylase subunit alpha
MDKTASNHTRDAIKAQHKKGKLTAFERIELLLDKGSFTELNADMALKCHDFGLQEKKTPGDGVITGFGKIRNRPICIFAQDFIFMGGSMGEVHNRKIALIQEHALKVGIPIIGLFDSGGARIQEGINSLDAGGNIFKNNTFSSGVIPQISVILGPCAGIAVYSPALTDFIFMTNKLSYMFITGPNVIKSVTGEEISFEGLGGSSLHSEKSGVSHFVAENEKECFHSVKLLLSYLPQNNLDSPPQITVRDSVERLTWKLDEIIPKDSKKSYDVKEVILELVDKNTFMEIQESFAQNSVVGLARLNSQTIGIVANQPMVLAGCLDIDSSNKIARFVRFCDSFNIPLINLVDVTGYLPGVNQEHNGIIRHGAKVLYAYSEATVPKISLIMRKAYGGAYIALASKEMGYDKVISWPSSEIAVMGAEQATNIIYRKELKSDKTSKVKAAKIKEYSEKFLNPNVAASYGQVDLIVDPKDTRKTLISCLEMMSTKRERRPSKKHGNIPL